MTVTSVLPYDAGAYPFTMLTMELLRVPGLFCLHEHLPCHAGATDQDTPVHQRFYDGFEQVLGPLYREFATQMVLPLFGEPLAVQKVPTFRVSPPGGTAVTEYHTDGDYRHQAGTVNFWVPLTRAYGSNTIRVESEPGQGDYKPVELVPGEMLMFDGVHLRHGNDRNVTGQTRVSFDFRVVPYRGFRAGGVSINRKVPMTVGGYYALLHPDGTWEG